MGQAAVDPEPQDICTISEQWSDAYLSAVLLFLLLAHRERSLQAGICHNQ